VYYEKCIFHSWNWPFGWLANLRRGRVGC